MASENELRINAALEGRRAHRARVEELAATWTAVTQAYDGLVAAIDDASHESIDLPPTGAALERVEKAVADLGGMVRERSAIPGRMADVARRIESLRHRVGRDTVNIGVLGRTRAGKSMLLRGITNLGKDVIPSSDWDSTTAAPSRIYHHPTESSATVYFHTWHSFRNGYLVPLHAAAGLGTAAHTLREFADHTYPQNLGTQERADKQRYLNRLLTAQRSLASYGPLLTGGSTRVPLAELYPYIAYPEKGDADQHRPYHAVSGVVIHHRFEDVEVARLGLIDLPGAGEAGLDVDQQFLQRLRDDLDMLLLVKRTVANDTFWSDADWDSIGLADSVRGGVSLADFVCIVVNHDEPQVSAEGLAVTTEQMRVEAGKRGIIVLTPNAARLETIQTDLMAPLLRHLAQQLPEMDRVAIRTVRIAAEEVAGEVTELATAVTTCLSGWQSAMPNEQSELRKSARKLRFALATALGEITDRYERAAATGDGAEPAFRQAIDAAVTSATAWVEGGLGAGSRQQWLDELKGGMISEGSALRERQYAVARDRIGKIFGQVDTSVDDSIRQLFDEIAAALRASFTEAVVPEEPDALDRLAATSQQRHGKALPVALKELSDVKSAYGKTLLRVTRPIIRTIREQYRPGNWPGALDAGTGSSGHTTSDADAEALARLRRAKSSANRSQPTPPTQHPRTAGSIPPASSTGEGWVSSARKDAEALYDELADVVKQRIGDLKAALLAEGRVMCTVLASATARFLDQAVQTPDVHFEYLDLCAPIQRTLWPGIFDGGPAQLGATLLAVESAAAALASASGSVRRLDE